MSVTYLNSEGPEPHVDDAGFWAHCERRVLAFQACAACGAVRHPPRPVCARCHSTATSWRPTKGEGRVFSFTWVHGGRDPSVAEQLPYNIVVVEFPDCEGVRLVTNLIDAHPGGIAIGMPVSLVWEEALNGMPLPRVRTA